MPEWSKKMEKKAGIRVDYDANLRPIASSTGDEWLAGMFKRDGSFMAPGALGHVQALNKHAMVAFVSELQKIAEDQKTSGFLGDAASAAKKVLTTPIPGTPELFPHAAIEAATRVGKPTATAAAGALKAAPKDWRAARAAAYRPAA